ncbi:hypothetical protein KC343_g180 [Hortaea werneckii]|nr:hypothetical protein KC342_g11561 [Hortaea werneckii]KAI6837767.1 hypothetical protein KC350_g6004 [Hortaea werneckii]KAI7293358.1 hypothetical protein KC352_g1677 [Hortaea werneckii]KAI7308873.1 hypothetical protein KC340_g10890 [Hortaea werneckii]KAI7394325.1 hypothetical protein KC328_g6190 [Hortaea werneckii]
MAAVVRPPSQPDEGASPALTRPSRQRVSRTEVDYRKLHRGILAKETALSTASGKSSETSESRLDTVLKAIAGVRESVDERIALVQEAIEQVPDIGQVKETVSEEVRDIVQEQWKATVQREIVEAIRDEVKSAVQQQVSGVVRREVKEVVQQEVKSIVKQEVQSIVQREVMNIVTEKVTAIMQQQVTTIVQQQVTSIVKEQVTAIVEKQLSSIQPSSNQASSPNPSYADVARTPPGSHPSNLRTLSNQTTPSTFTDTLYCTVDVSNVEEEERGRANASTIRQEVEEGMRKGERGSGWRCVAVTRDPRNSGRIRITCRDEEELARVKVVAERAKASGARVLRDKWYPVKVDNACRMAVLDENGDLRVGATEMMEKENEVKIAKLSWLSRKDSPKAYGSMVVYVTKRADAARLLDGQYFNVDGESAFTRVFEPRRGPMECAAGALNQATVTANARRTVQSVRSAADHTNRLAANVGSFIQRLMYRLMRFLQLNVQKQRNVQHSMMNDVSLKEYAALMVSEPHVLEMDGKLTTSPMGHQGWTAILPSERHHGRWAIRSMLWVRRDIECEQIEVPSADLTVALLRLQDRSILVASVYVEGSNASALSQTMDLLRQAICSAGHRGGPRLDLVIAGDFNRHDQLWGGDEVLSQRQGEADPIIDFMGEWSLESLLPRGTKTWQDSRYATTIDLMLVSQELAANVGKCKIHDTEHGSDHRAIETTFDVDLPERVVEPRLLYKNAPWKEIRERTARALQQQRPGATVQEQADRLMHAVQDAVHALTPRAKPCPYAKRWWTQDLTKLRRVYTYWRNRARAQRRDGEALPILEQQARAASKEYHDAIHRQQRTHWDDFLADDANIWKATRYLQPDQGSRCSRIPQLRRADGSLTKNTAEQAEQLLATFFPQLPEDIEEEGDRPQRTAVAMPQLTGEEIESCVIPQQWKVAKIIPLKKPNKGDYTLAKAWRPISLLSTLGKLLEAVVAERVSFAVETYGLLPANHFGARKQRSAEQALLLLQEHIYTAWRNKRVVSLVSFDVKGAYDGVYKDRLLQRLQARGIPSDLVKWIDAFCSERTATIVVNGQASGVRALEQAGLPQGSPLSPILFLFFNADLVQQRIDQNGGAIAFVDDYTAWVVGKSAAENMYRLQGIVQRATEWESRSGASFEGDKTAFTHFTRNKTHQSSEEPITVKGEEIRPTPSVKILGLVMDSRLRYQEHAARAATKGLRGLSPSVTRKLFNATVAPAVDYASSVWMHARRASAERVLKRVQRIGGQAVVGCFQTVGTAVAEAEANLPTIEERHKRKALKMWVDLRSMPGTHPLALIARRPACKRFVSPMQKIAEYGQGAPLDDLEATQPYISAPWDARPDTVDGTDDGLRSAARAQETHGIRIATSASVRNQLVGIGGAIESIDRIRNHTARHEYDKTLGTIGQSDAYTAALASIEAGLGFVVGAVYAGTLSARVYGHIVRVFTNNRTVLITLRASPKRTRQWIIGGILKHVEFLKGFAIRVVFAWAPVSSIFELGQRAKQLAQRSTDEGRVASDRPRLTKRIVLKAQQRLAQATAQMPTTFGEAVRRIDAAWPGNHTRRMYDELSKRQASVLSQLRTGMTPLNGYLHNI